jgi:hypothetical protein
VAEIHEISQTRVDNDVAKLAYCAGFFDGEGHICIAYSKAKIGGSPKSKYARYSLRVAATQCSGPVIQWMKDNFGGRVYYSVGKRSYDDGQYGRWNWELSSARAATFLAAIRPWLIVKAEEADLALKFQATMNRKTGRSPISAEVTEFRRYCHGRIREIRSSARRIAA